VDRITNHHVHELWHHPLRTSRLCLHVEINARWVSVTHFMLGQLAPPPQGSTTVDAAGFDGFLTEWVITKPSHLLLGVLFVRPQDVHQLGASAFIADFFAVSSWHQSSRDDAANARRLTSLKEYMSINSRYLSLVVPSARWQTTGRRSRARTRSVLFLGGCLYGF